MYMIWRCKNTINIHINQGRGRPNDKKKIHLNIDNNILRDQAQWRWSYISNLT